MRIRPITYRTACEYVDAHHRHHGAPQGCKWAIGVYDGDTLHGVAICGRPTSRRYDDGTVCEITRVCTDGTKNACSMLYGACARIAKHMGYDSIITYLLESENGASVKAANFVCEGQTGGTHWTGVRNRGQNIPHEMKTRWRLRLRGEHDEQIH
jgi:hypothetical protein